MKTQEVSMTKDTMNKTAATDTAAPAEKATKSEGSGRSLSGFLVFAGVGATLAVGVSFMAETTKKDILLEALSSAEVTYDMASARSAEGLIEGTFHAVERAVQVTSVDDHSMKNVICATNEAGDLELFTFGKFHHTADVEKVAMNAELEAAAPAFCDAAFAQLNK
jgi:hypothetical protein